MTQIQNKRLGIDEVIDLRITIHPFGKTEAKKEGYKRVKIDSNKVAIGNQQIVGREFFQNHYDKFFSFS